MIYICTVYLVIWNVQKPASLALKPGLFTTTEKKIILLQEYAAEVSGKNSISHNLAIGFSSKLYYTPHFCSSLFYVEVTSNIEH